MTRTHRMTRKTHEQREPRDRRPSTLVNTEARVRSIGLTPQGHLAVVLDTPAGRLKALSDAAGVHQSELAVGREVQVALLRLRRVTEDAVWHWQLLGCRGVQTQNITLEHSEQAGSLA